LSRKDDHTAICRGIPIAVRTVPRMKARNAITGPRLLALIAAAIAAMTIGILTVVSPLPDAAHALVRWTARTSLVLFSLAYVARPRCSCGRGR
jgi:hypothetical protein